MGSDRNIQLMSQVQNRQPFSKVCDVGTASEGEQRLRARAVLDGRLVQAAMPQHEGQRQSKP